MDPGLSEEVMAALGGDDAAPSSLDGLAPLALKYALAAVDGGLGLPLEAGLRLESALFALCFATEDAREGTRAFLEKRPPKFRGR
jgi:enoyl-CoA hydratase/carnithine racemase